MMRVMQMDAYTSINLATRFTMPYGKYQGKTLGEIAESDEGLEYLSWLRNQGWLAGHKVAKNIKSLFEDSNIMCAVYELENRYNELQFGRGDDNFYK